ncbi:MAG: hypothetical protein JW861_03065 [Bacteroidales bacterium]|nr:hypothetical protein [Bacteroidales bacterium]
MKVRDPQQGVRRNKGEGRQLHTSVLLVSICIACLFPPVVRPQSSVSLLFEGGPNYPTVSLDEFDPALGCFFHTGIDIAIGRVFAGLRPGIFHQRFRETGFEPGPSGCSGIMYRFTYFRTAIHGGYLMLQKPAFRLGVSTGPGMMWLTDTSLEISYNDGTKKEDDLPHYNRPRQEDSYSLCTTLQAAWSVSKDIRLTAGFNWDWVFTNNEFQYEHKSMPFRRHLFGLWAGASFRLLGDGYSR